MILPQGNDLVYNLDALEPAPLRLADQLGVATPLGDEVDDVEHLRRFGGFGLQKGGGKGAVRSFVSVGGPNRYCGAISKRTDDGGVKKKPGVFWRGSVSA